MTASHNLQTNARLRLPFPSTTPKSNAVIRAKKSSGLIVFLRLLSTGHSWRMRPKRTAGVKFSASAGGSLTPWPSIVEIGTTRQAIYFFVNSLNAYIVPRRAFSTETNYNEFVRCALEFLRPHAV
jgi:hypothetical protein